MCENYERKYHQYEIKVEFLNGDMETINYDEYNPRSYKEMLELYNDTKEQYKNDCVTIKFCGKTKEGEAKVFFEKQIINEDLKIKEEADRIASTDGVKVLENLRQAIEDVKKYGGYVGGQVNVNNKNQDILLHKIEKCNNLNVEEKLKMINNLHTIRVERRKAKDGQRIVNNFNNSLENKNINLPIIVDIIGECLQNYKESISNIIPLENEEIIEQLKIKKTVKYRNFKERINLMKQLGRKYDKIYYDDSKMEITCYNKSK